MSVASAPVMPLYSVGDVVIVPFPSSAGDLPKRRPAIVLAVVAYGSTRDYIVCLITSQAAPDPARISLTQGDIIGGFLLAQSYLRPAYLYTAFERLIVRRIATLAPNRLEEAVTGVVQLLRPQLINPATANKP